MERHQVIISITSFRIRKVAHRRIQRISRYYAGDTIWLKATISNITQTGLCTISSVVVHIYRGFVPPRNGSPQKLGANILRLDPRIVESGWKIRVNPRLHVSRIASGVRALPRTIRDAARIESVISPNSDARAPSIVRTLFACNSYRIFPRPQIIDSRRESVDCVLHIENVFRTPIALSSPVNEYLLHDETDWICDLHSRLVCEWEAVARRESNAPGRG